jgi:hypothetical protein
MINSLKIIRKVKYLQMPKKLTPAQFFEQIPVEQAWFAKRMGISRQFFSVIIRENPISDFRLKQLKELIKQFANEINEIEITAKVYEGKKYKWKKVNGRRTSNK